MMLITGANGRARLERLRREHVAEDDLDARQVTQAGLRRLPRTRNPDYRARVKAAFGADVDGRGWDAVTRLLTPDTPSDHSPNG